jgi:activin receptor type-1
MFLHDIHSLILCVIDITGQVPPYPDSTSYIMKLTLAILGPVLALGLLGALVLLLMRRTHRKRLMSARNMADPETYYASDDLLRVTAAGDSTLRVFECHFQSNTVDTMM